MNMGFGCNFNKGKGIAYDLNLEPFDDENCDLFDNKNEIGSNCPICLEPLVSKADYRTTVKLRCDHQFHLDCIGSAFNAKNKMQCPTCRNVEQGRWLYANGPLYQNFDTDIDIASLILEPHQLDFGSYPNPLVSDLVEPVWSHYRMPPLSSQSQNEGTMIRPDTFWHVGAPFAQERLLHRMMNGGDGGEYQGNIGGGVRGRSSGGGSRGSGGSGSYGRNGGDGSGGSVEKRSYGRNGGGGNDIYGSSRGNNSYGRSGGSGSRGNGGSDSYVISSGSNSYGISGRSSSYGTSGGGGNRRSGGGGSRRSGGSDSYRRGGGGGSRGTGGSDSYGRSGGGGGRGSEGSGSYGRSGGGGGRGGGRSGGGGNVRVWQRRGQSS